MEKLMRTKTEYGGFLPLELNPGQEWFAKYEPYLIRFNSVKASLAYLIKEIDLKKIYIPYYYCPSTIEAIKKTGITVDFYHIDSNLMPRNLPDETNSIVMVVDYFGVRSKQIKKVAASFRKATVILDCAHAFYAEPILNERIYNVYSAKKFFGIPDGSYIVSKNLMSICQTSSCAYQYAEYLLTTYEVGTNVAYGVKKEADKLIANNYDVMSRLAIGLLQNVDYERVACQRRGNYKVLHEAFANINELQLPKECVAYQYPLLLSEKGNEIKKELITDKIFVSTLWSGDELTQSGTAFELNMSENALFLPMDQRYDELDMQYIVMKIKGLLNEDT